MNFSYYSIPDDGDDDPNGEDLANSFQEFINESTGLAASPAAARYMEQVEAHLPQIARLVGTYYNALIEEGIDPTTLHNLTINYQQNLIQRGWL